MPIKLVLFMLLSLTSCQVYPGLVPQPPASTDPQENGPCIHLKLYGQIFAVQQFRIQCPSYEHINQSLEGVVQNQNTKIGLAGVAVSLSKLEKDGRLSAAGTTLSDKDGRYSLSFPSEGTYRLRLIISDYTPIERTLRYDFEGGSIKERKTVNPLMIELEPVAQP